MEQEFLPPRSAKSLIKYTTASIAMQRQKGLGYSLIKLYSIKFISSHIPFQ